MKKQILSIITLLGAGAMFAQTVPNNGMELWGASFGQPEEPTSYVSENILASPLLGTGNPTSVFKVGSGEQNSGTYAAKITTVKQNSNPMAGTIPDTVGVLLLGSITTSPSFGLKSGTAWTSTLASVDFYYKYAPVSGDNGAVASYLTHWNTGTNHRDTLAAAYYPFTTTVSTYTQASAPFIYDSNYTGETPDTLHLYFLSSARPWLPTLPSPARIGSALWIDDISTTPLGIKSNIKSVTEIKAYPNPANNVINLSASTDLASTAEIIDVTGKVVATGVFTDRKVRFDANGLAEGLYIYSVKDKDKNVIGTGKVNVTK